MILSGLCDGFLCGFKKVERLYNKLRKLDCEKKRGMFLAGALKNSLLLRFREFSLELRNFTVVKERIILLKFIIISTLVEFPLVFEEANFYCCTSRRILFGKISKNFPRIL